MEERSLNTVLWQHWCYCSWLQLTLSVYTIIILNHFSCSTVARCSAIRMNSHKQVPCNLRAHIGQGQLLLLSLGVGTGLMKVFWATGNRKCPSDEETSRVEFWGMVMFGKSWWISRGDWERAAGDARGKPVENYILKVGCGKNLGQTMIWYIRCYWQLQKKSVNQTLVLAVTLSHKYRNESLIVVEKEETMTVDITYLKNIEKVFENKIKEGFQYWKS